MRKQPLYQALASCVDARLHTVNIKISGRDRNDVKSYLHETFDLALRATVEE